MTEDHIKEHLSRDFLRLISHRLGYCFNSPESDSGVDGTLSEVQVVPGANGSHSYCPSGAYIDVQLKCTTEASIERDNGVIKYDLRAKNYNDLVRRRQKQGGVTPLILVLCILPANPAEWLSVSPDALALASQGFWYMPADVDVETENQNTKRVQIPEGNLIGADSIPQLFADFYS